MFWMKLEKPGQESEIERISDSRPARTRPAARGEDSSRGAPQGRSWTMHRQQDVNDDAQPERWVPVLDAVEAVIDRIVRENARRREPRSESADAARA